MISRQVFGIVYHLNGLSGNTNIRYNKFPAQDMIFFNFEKKIMEINGHKADEIDAFWKLFESRTLFYPSLFELLKVTQKLRRH